MLSESAQMWSDAEGSSKALDRIGVEGGSSEGIESYGDNRI